MPNAYQGTRQNHMNQGTYRTQVARHQETRLPDPEDISGGGNPGTHSTLLAVHQNQGPHRSMAAQHQKTRLADAPSLPVDIMDKD